MSDATSATYLEVVHVVKDVFGIFRDHGHVIFINGVLVGLSDLIDFPLVSLCSRGADLWPDARSLLLSGLGLHAVDIALIDDADAVILDLDSLVLGTLLDVHVDFVNDVEVGILLVNKIFLGDGDRDTVDYTCSLCLRTLDSNRRTASVGSRSIGGSPSRSQGYPLRAAGSDSSRNTALDTSVDGAFLLAVDVKLDVLLSFT